MTTLTRPAAAGLLIAGLAALAGCGDGGPRLAPVSGVVKVDGKPYGQAVVTFQPLASKENPNPGRTSSAYTDENGRFVLMYDGVKPGAAVGKHRVRIQTKGADVSQASGDGTGSDDYTPPASVKTDPIPAEWGGLSTKEFEVPPGGTDKADFDIESRKPGKGKKGDKK